jgi:hypothetical protein
MISTRHGLRSIRLPDESDQELRKTRLRAFRHRSLIDRAVWPEHVGGLHELVERGGRRVQYLARSLEGERAGSCLVILEQSFSVLIWAILPR